MTVHEDGFIPVFPAILPKRIADVMHSVLNTRNLVDVLSGTQKAAVSSGVVRMIDAEKRVVSAGNDAFCADFDACHGG